MAHLSTQAQSFILDNYADAIEGGSAYRGSGTAYTGIPGSYSNDPQLRNGTDDDVTASSNGTTTTIVYASGTWAADRWAKTNTPQYYAVCTAATNAANVGAARRISNWTLSSTTFTVDAFPAATTSADTFKILQGFKRAPNEVDLERDDGDQHGWDRFFQLSALPGEPTIFYGKGMRSYNTTMRLRLRMLKYDRDRDARGAVFENLRILRDGLVDQSHYESTYTRALLPEEGSEEVITDDARKIVASIGLRLIYRVNTTFL